MLGAKKVLLVCGALVLCASSAVGTYLLLDNLGAIELKEPINLIFSLDDKSKVYDGKPLVPDSYSLDGELLEGHEAIVYYMGNQTEVGISTGEATVKIVDTSGKDVSKEYDIVVESSTLEVTKKELNVEFLDQVLEYTGEDLYGCEYKITSGSLVYGHKIVPNVDGVQVDVGIMYNISFDPRIYDALNNDVTSNYDLTFKAGEIEIIQRDIEIELKSYSKEYDGTKFVPEVYVSEGSLAPGHKIKAVFEEDLVNAFSKTSKLLEVTIVDRKGNDVTGNYGVSGLEVEVEILKKQLSVELPHIEKVYDGKSIDEELDKYIEGYEMINGLNLVYDSSSLSKDVLSESKRLDSSVFSVEGENLQNYIINFINGSYLITPKTINIKPKINEVNYIYGDKLPQSADWELTNEALIGSDSVSSVTYQITDEKNHEMDNLNKTGKLFISIDDVVVNGNSDNYMFISEKIEVNVAQKEISFSLKNDMKNQKTYDGNPLVINPETIEVNNINKGDKLSEIILSQDYYSVSPTQKTDSIKGFVILNEKGEDVSSYYTLTQYPTLGELKVDITSRLLELSIPSIEVTYDENLTKDDIEKIVKTSASVSSNTPLLNGDYITIDDISVSGISLTPGAHVVNVYLGDVYDKYGNSVGNSYDIIVSECVVVIKKLNVTVVLPTLTKTYDGEPFGEEVGRAIRLMSLRDCDFDLDTDISSYVDAGSYTLTKDDISISNEEVYDVTVVPGTLVIQKKELKIQLPKIEKEYSGSDFELDVSTLVEGASVEGCEVTFVGSFSYVDAGVYPIRDSDVSLSVDDNYSATIIPGSLTINKKKLVIELPTIEREYTGYDYNNEVLTQVEARSVEGCEITLNTIYDQINASQYPITEKDISLNLDSNYQVEIKPGSLNIYKKEVVINLPEFEREYTGSDFNDEIADYINNMYVDGLDISYVGSFYDATSKYYPIRESDISVTVYDPTNYSYTVNEGYLDIYKKEVVINLPEFEREYTGSDFNDEIADYINNMYVEGLDISYVGSFYDATSKHYPIRESDISVMVYDPTNYSYTVNEGYLNITKRQVTINLPQFDREYTGSDFNDEIADYINNMSIEGVDITYIGNFYNAASNYYPIRERDISVMVYDPTNYSYTVNEGYLNITKKQVTINLPRFDREYTGSDFNDEIADYINNMYVDGLDISYVGSFYNSIPGLYPIRQNAIDVTLYDPINYTYTVNEGYLNITKKQVIINLPELEREYTGYDFNEEIRNIIENGSYPDGMSVTYTGNIIDTTPGTYYINSNLIRYYEDPNCEYIVNTGRLVIKEKEIVIYLPTIQKEYTGSDFNEIIRQEIDNMYYPDGCDITYNGEITSIIPGEYPITRDHLILSLEPHHKITIHNGLLRINPKVVDVYLPNITRTYTGLDFNSDIESYIDSMYLEGCSITYLNNISSIEPGEYIISHHNISYHLDSHHEISIHNGLLIITKKHVTIDLPNITRTYTGNDFNSLVELYINAINIDGVYIDYQGSFTNSNAGTYLITAEDIRVTTEDYVEYQVNMGSLIIEKAYIDIHLPELTYQKGDTTRSIQDEVYYYVSSQTDLTNIDLITNLNNEINNLEVGEYYYLTNYDFDYDNKDNVYVNFVPGRITIIA